MNEQNTFVVTWDQFKEKISAHVKNHGGSRICRGQSNSNWTLTTTFHRNPSGITFPTYFRFLEHLSDIVGTIENKNINIKDHEVNGAFLAYLQHHGFPTPLLDWSNSPYVAAYFAFSDVIDSKPASDYISVFSFANSDWLKTFKQNYDYNSTEPHVSLLRPKTFGNLRQIKQQGSNYLWTNVVDIGAHVREQERLQNKTFLEIYNIPVTEKFYAMTDLDIMGINAFNLFGTTDSLCRYYKELIFRKDNEGMSPVERILAMSEKEKQSKKTT